MNPILKDILKTFSNGNGWRHVLFALSASILAMTLKLFSGFGEGFIENAGQCFVICFIIFWLGWVLEWYQAKYCEGTFSYPDIFWGVAGTFIGWILSRFFPDSNALWITALCVFIGIPLMILIKGIINKIMRDNL